MTELTVIRVPRVDPALPPLVIDMESLITASARLQEVAMANAHRGPELLAMFNIAYLTASRFISALEYEYQVAEQKVRQIKSIILLDRMKDILQEKGLANPRNPLGSEDVRQAVYEADPDYIHATTVSMNILCRITQLQDSRKGFQNAYDAVKKVMGGDQMSGYRQNMNLVVPLTNNQAPQEPPEDDFFGTAR